VPFFFTIIFFLVSLLIPKTANAISQFTTTYDISYTINSAGGAHVVYDVTQVNNLSSIYATDFSLSLSQTNLKNILIKDEGTIIKPEIETTDNLTNISFPFANKIVGKDKIHRFTISFDSEDIAAKTGAIWEINIPQLISSEEDHRQNIKLTIPPELKDPAYISPNPNKIEKNTYFFNSVTLGNRSITAVFGKTQYFKFNLYYNLENPTGSYATTTITLPPDTAYQKMFYQKIEPHPESVSLDPDGNWIATIKLAPDSITQVKTEGVVKINFEPIQSSLSEPSIYLKNTTQWPTDNQAIIQIANKLTTPESIFQFVHDKLSYNYARLNESQKRPGAIFALENPTQSLCTEYTDLFIALARSKNIPARELQGFAFSSNEKLRPQSLSQDVLHSWPEYFDVNKNTWIQVDPTWTDTTKGIDYFHKLDLNHFVFVIHGQNTLSPPPAGAYKTESSNSKDIYVTPTEAIEFPKPQIKTKITSITSKYLTFQIENTGQISFNQNITISDPTINLNHSISLNLPIFATETVKIPLEIGLFQSTNSQLIIKTNDQEEILPITYQIQLPTNFLPETILVILVIIGAFIAWRLRLRRQTPPPPIHW
jgi:hypothetical protein